ncbi:penicillin-binding protein 1A [Acetobacter sp.]|jgi:penicillin-binding protein 1A|uniref:penicillin-binding protein 1A n=1 Tax=Acetobacter sp. TaxID=440 RepID=UPI0025BC9AFA|nr:PBP1A family penicillin-binding protein [Acetobacter sp.]MCH4090876.1 PBP1A family penicillin-binding protein [Acetobacter sp.]MCI1301040.1 PBP1A family penicillin-binding protein [Acetobacter sp.]MCI1317364.1 PBP1A family penicillin-binding protein [Acetobacter sp.]
MISRPVFFLPLSCNPVPAGYPHHPEGRGAVLGGSIADAWSALVVQASDLSGGRNRPDLRVSSSDRLEGGYGGGNFGGGGSGGGSGGGVRPPFRGGPPRRPRFRMWRKLLGTTVAVLLLGTATAGVVVWYKYAGLVSDLPTVEGLRSYQPPVMSRLYSGDDRLIAELAAERRVFVPYSAIPDRVKNAFLAAEDQKFWSHKGIDPVAILRAGLTDLSRGKGRRPLGASTITQQVARIMLLGSNALSMERKAKEALLALRVEQVLPKEKILEIYLNEIYLGDGAYGIGAASQAYFNKPLDQLDDSEAAFLAALPKSPTNYNPYRYPEAARNRRNWILDRMQELGWLDAQSAEAARQEALSTKSFRRPGPAPGSEWFSEEVRRELIEKYGVQQTMQGGLDVHTSFDPVLQTSVTAALRDGLMAYDRSHGGWRGAVGHLDTVTRSAAQDEAAWTAALAAAPHPRGMLDRWRLAVVLDSGNGTVGWLESGTPHRAALLAKDMGWMRVYRALRPGDLLMVEPQAEGGRVAIRQIPRVEGAVVTMDVHTGRVLAMSGGWSFESSQFNRASQAMRQPGSSFKPFVYLTAMEQGVSPSQKFDDSAVSYGSWHPNNYEKDFWGATTLHDALRESRNLVTIRLAAHIGIKSVARLAEDIGLVQNMPHVLPAALGAVETTVLREAGAYATIANGGHKVTPTLIDDVQDRNGHILWRPEGLTLSSLAQAQTPAVSPSGTEPNAVFPDAGQGDNASARASQSPSGGTVVPEAGQSDVPALMDTRPAVSSEASAFQITTMLQDVIKRGTGQQAGVGIDNPIAGKTGTSQDFNDAWFAGYSADLVTIVWIGFDQPQSLGKNETGGTIAGPIWNRIMKSALEGRPKLDFPVPEGVTLVRYDTGRGVTVDAFKDDQVPGGSSSFAAGSPGTGELTAADTGAENLPDSESDMSSGGASESSAPSSSGSGTNSAATPAPAQQPSGGDIGMGGLY